MTELLDDVTLLDDLEAMLAAAGRGLPSQQPSRAETVVTVYVRETDDGVGRPWATLFLDRDPVVVDARSDTTAEIEIFFTRTDLQRFIQGDLQLPLAIATGNVDFSGPVRKFLRVTPVLRAFAKGGLEQLVDAGPTYESVGSDGREA
ncbi:MAG: hypothetical protein JWR63_3397 [Conexibacter sp.]|nr:hypothetical protein [Conexibacter sp.]